MRRVFAAMPLVFLLSCLGIPVGITPVENFVLSRYLGTWYEIARLDHSFERGLSKVTAEYSLRDDGGVNVVNRGYNKSAGAWEEATGRAYFVEGDFKGYLKVSFFGPFYGSYIIFALDQENYQYAYVTGPDKSYLWLLSRKKAGNQALVMEFIKKAKELGYETDKLIFVEQDP